MMELTIKEQVYQFTFGMGFLREVNKQAQRPVDGFTDLKESMGLQMMVAGLRVRDCEYLVKALEAANKAHNPRVSRVLLDAHIDDPETDIDALFDDVMDFLRRANATKNVVIKALETMDEEEAKLKAKN